MLDNGKKTAMNTRMIAAMNTRMIVPGILLCVAKNTKTVVFLPNRGPA